jgi:hypothetical protein
VAGGSRPAPYTYVRCILVNHELRIRDSKNSVQEPVTIARHQLPRYTHGGVTLCRAARPGPHGRPAAPVGQVPYGVDGGTRKVQPFDGGQLGVGGPALTPLSGRSLFRVTAPPVRQYYGGHMNLPQQGHNEVVSTPTALHPESVHAPAWKSRHVLLKVNRWSDGWKGTVDMWRHGAAGSLNEWTTDDRRTYAVEWGQHSPLTTCELTQMLWMTCHAVARQIEGLTLNPYTVESCICRPPAVPWIGATAGLTPTGKGTNLYAYLTGKGHTSSKPNEQRLCSVDLETVGPALPVSLISSLGYLVEQHAR